MIDKCNFFIYNKPTSIVYLHKLFIYFSNFLAQGKISKTLDLFNLYIYIIYKKMIKSKILNYMIITWKANSFSNDKYEMLPLGPARIEVKM